MSAAPRWPPWTLAAMLVALVAGGVVVSLAVALLALAFGADDNSPALGLLISLATLALVVAGLRFVAGRAGVRLPPEGVGLRAPTPRMTLVILGFGVIATVLIGLAQALLFDTAPELPPELRSERPFGAQPAIVLDAASVTTVLARAVVLAVAVEIATRGYFLPALAQFAGRPIATGVVAAMWALADNVADVRLAAVVLGVVLCVMYFESGSILPGTAVHAGAHAYLLGASFGWSAAESLALALAAAAAAYALALGVARLWSWDRAHLEG